MQKKIKHPSTASIKHKNLFLYYIVSSEINQNIPTEGLNTSCILFNWTCFHFLMSAKSNDITDISVKLILVQKIAYSSIHDILRNKEQRFESLTTV